MCSCNTSFCQDIHICTFYLKFFIIFYYFLLMFLKFLCFTGIKCFIFTFKCKIFVYVWKKICICLFENIYFVTGYYSYSIRFCSGQTEVEKKKHQSSLDFYTKYSDSQVHLKGETFVLSNGILGFLLKGIQEIFCKVI